MPLWANVVFGVSLLLIGFVFFVLPQKGSSTSTRLVFLVAYLFLAGFYLMKAYRQYRARSGT
jgi:hypothetical protein